VDRGEPPGRSGLFQSGGAWQRSGLADQGFQVVVEIETRAGFGHQPLVPGNLFPAVIDDQVGGMQLDADLPADQAHRH
jgi:hypothetical protein